MEEVKKQIQQLLTAIEQCNGDCEECEMFDPVWLGWRWGPLCDYLKYLLLDYREDSFRDSGGK